MPRHLYQHLQVCLFGAVRKEAGTVDVVSVPHPGCDSISWEFLKEILRSRRIGVFLVDWNGVSPFVHSICVSLYL